MDCLHALEVYSYVPNRVLLWVWRCLHGALTCPMCKWFRPTLPVWQMSSHFTLRIPLNTGVHGQHTDCNVLKTINLKNNSKSSRLQHCPWQLVWGVCVDKYSQMWHKGIVPHGLWFIQMQLCKTKLCCHVIVWERKLSPGNSSKQTTLLLSFLNVLSWTLTFSWGL